MAWWTARWTNKSPRPRPNLCPASSAWMTNWWLREKTNRSKAAIRSRARHTLPCPFCYHLQMPHTFTTSYLEDSLAVFMYYKKLAERAMEQTTDEQLFTVLDNEMNSVAIIVKHMVGNMRSRWTDFLKSDGEKPDRNR